MDDTREILLRSVRPERWAKMKRAADRRLGCVRVVLENLHHPHNMSALLRTCEAFGIQHVHAVETVEAFTVSRRITLGAHKWLTLRRHRCFDECAAELKALGFRLAAAMLDPGAVPLEDVGVEEPLAVVFGNEKQGVSPEARALCDFAFTIPMAGFVQSLNISVAAAISIHELTARARRRSDGGLLSEGERSKLLESWLPKSVRCGRRVLAASGESGPEPQPSGGRRPRGTREGP